MSGKTFAYVSSWTHGDGDGGLYLYDFDRENGGLSLIRRLDDKTDFGVSWIDQKRGMLYILDESIDFPGLSGGGGRLFAYQTDPETGNIQEVSCVPTHCPNPSYVTMDSTGKYLVVSNHGGKACVTKLVQDSRGKFHSSIEYDDSVVELFALNEDGSVGELLDAVKHTGSGPNRRQQSNAHPHCAVMSPSGRLFTVCDKGNDGIYMYQIDRQRNKLIPAGLFLCEPGSMPRFCAYHPTLPYFYQNNEGKAEVCAYRYEENGSMERIGSFSAVTEENAKLSGSGVQQDLRIDRTGNYLYSIVHDSGIIAVYQIDQGSGKLDLIQNQKINAAWPRGCALSPDGRYLAVTAQKSGHVLTLAVGEDGMLTETGVCVQQPFAAFVTFYQP